MRGAVAGDAAAWLSLGQGSGAPLIVLHGAGLDRAGASWGRVLPALAARQPVIAPDLPGHGETAPLAVFGGTADLARWLVAFMDTRGIDRAALTGVSMGGAVALQVALAVPERVTGVVPVASYGLARRGPLHPLLHAGTRLPLARMTDAMIARSSWAAWLALRAIVHDAATISDEMVAELRAIAADTRAERAFDRFLATEIAPAGFRTVLGDALPHLAVPALFVHGVHDRSVPVGAARRAARAASAPLRELDAGHWPMFEAPKPFLATVQPFLDGLGT